MTIERAELEMPEEVFEELKRLKVIKTVGDKISITFLDDCKAEVHAISEKNRANAAKKYAKDKLGKEKSTEVLPTDATAMPPQATALPNDAEERREEERREEKTTTSSTASSLHEFAPNKEHAKALIQDEMYLNTAGINSKVFPISKMKDYIVTFHEHLIQEGKVHHKFTDFRKHFNSWLRIQTEKNIQPIHRYDNK